MAATKFTKGLGQDVGAEHRGLGVSGSALCAHGGTRRLSEPAERAVSPAVNRLFSSAAALSTHLGVSFQWRKRRARENRHHR